MPRVTCRQLGMKSAEALGLEIPALGRGRGKEAVVPAVLMSCCTDPLIFQLLEENDQLIRCIVEYQNKGRANECVQ